MTVSQREQQKKDRERVYLDCFLTLVPWKATVEDCGERPDFILARAGIAIGVEVTELLKASGSTDGGSTVKRAEKRRAEFVRTLATQYYADGGRPARVQSLWYGRGERPPSPKAVPALIAAREPLADWQQGRVYLAHDEIYHITALPVNAGQHTDWRCVTDLVGWVRAISADDLAGIIAAKAAKLEEYHQRASQMILLIVSDRTTNAGKWSVPATLVGIDPQGFDEVYVLLFPSEFRRVDRSPTS